jgi:hypothetical protein
MDKESSTMQTASLNKMDSGSMINFNNDYIYYDISIFILI